MIGLKPEIDPKPDINVKDDGKVEVEWPTFKWNVPDRRYGRFGFEVYLNHELNPARLPHRQPYEDFGVGVRFTWGF